MEDNRHPILAFSVKFEPLLYFPSKISICWMANEGLGFSHLGDFRHINHLEWIHHIKSMDDRTMHLIRKNMIAQENCAILGQAASMIYCS